MKALFDIFFEPGKVFAGLPARKGAWIVPLLANMILLTANTALVINLVGMQTIVRQRLEQIRLSPEQMQVAMARATSPAQVYVSYIGAALGGALVIAIIAGALYAFGLMTSKEPKYSWMFAMVSLSLFPYFLVTAVMTALILMAAPNRDTLDIQNLIATNLGAYMNKDQMAKGMYSLMSSLDLLSFLEMGLMALGFSKLTRAGFFAGLAAVLALWVVYVSVKMAVSLIF